MIIFLNEFADALTNRCPDDRAGASPCKSDWAFPQYRVEPAALFVTPLRHEKHDVFMLLVLDEAKMQGVSGLAKYRHEFSTIA